MAEATFYPDANPEVTSVDGYTDFESVSDVTWGSLRTSAGNISNDVSAVITLTFEAGATTNGWWYLSRGIILFDISSIPLSSIIVSAVLSVYGQTKYNGVGGSPAYGLYASSPSSNTVLVDADHNIANWGGTILSDTIAHSAFNDAGWNAFTLNSDGIAVLQSAIGGVAKLGIREKTYDADAATPPWVSNEYFRIGFYAADQGTNKPKLVITYTQDIGASGNFAGGAGGYGGTIKRKRSTTYQEDLIAARRLGYEHPINKILRVKRWGK